MRGVRQLAKQLVRGSAHAFPVATNTIWKALYPALIYKGANNYATALEVAGERQQVFEAIFRGNAWRDAESVSGHGSTLHNTALLRKALPKLLKQYRVATFLDAPCGDFHWMQHVEMPDGVSYLGCDIVAGLIDDLAVTYAGPNRSFKVLDIVEGPIPRVDMWLCRDVIFHLTLADGLRVLENAARSGVGWFVSTTNDFATTNVDIATGAFRLINLRSAPYSLPAPMAEIDDFLAPNVPQKLGVWTGEQLRQRFGSSRVARRF